MIAVLDPPDACPDCDPGVPDVALPLAAPEHVGGGTLASYECSSCGIGWQTLFDANGWPVSRLTAPVLEAPAPQRDAAKREAA